MGGVCTGTIVLLLMALSVACPYGVSASSTEADILREEILRLFCMKPTGAQEDDILDGDILHDGTQEDDSRKRIVENMTIPSIYEHFPEMSELGSLVEMREGLELCKENLVDENDKGYHSQMLRIVSNLLDEFESLRALRQDLREAHDWISDTASRPLLAKEWPPDGLCPTCPQDWEAVGKLVAAIKEIRGLTQQQEPKALKAAVDSNHELEVFRTRFCSSIDDFEEIKWGWIETELKYFTWTQTWNYLEEMKHKVSSKEIKAVCEAR